VNEIILNSIYLNITKVDFHQHDFDTYLYGTVKYDKEYEQAIIEFDEHLNVILD